MRVPIMLSAIAISLVCLAITDMYAQKSQNAPDRKYDYIHVQMHISSGILSGTRRAWVSYGHNMMPDARNPNVLRDDNNQIINFSGLPSVIEYFEDLGYELFQVFPTGEATLTNILMRKPKTTE